MLQKLRDQTQGTGFKILVAAIIIVLTLFGFGATNLFLVGSPEITSVGDFAITQAILEAETERERRRLLSRAEPDFDPSEIDRLQLQESALQQLISQQVLTQTANNLGVRVTEAHVNQELLNGPAYQVDGQFNEAIYRQQVQILGYTPLDFVSAFSDALSSEQVRDGVTNSAFVPAWELAEMVRVVNQRRDLAYLPLTLEQFSKEIEITDEDIALRYEEDAALYMTELAVDAAYLVVSVDDLLQAPEIEVTDEALQSLYEDDRSQALGDQQRDSSHILLRVGPERDEAAASALLTEIATRVNDGEDFGELATEYSEDPGSAAQQGALGVVGKGIFAPEFEQALWALENPGDLSAPVKTEFGYHLIRLNSVEESDYPAFDEQRQELEVRVRRGQAEDLFADRALELERLAYDERYSLDSTAQALGLSLHRGSKISAEDAGEDVILAEPKVLEAMFGFDVLDGQNSAAIELGSDQMVIVRVEEQYPPEQIDLAQVRDRIHQTLVAEQAREDIAQARESGLSQLQAGDSVTEIADQLGSRWQTGTLLGRSGNGEIPQEVMQYAFTLARPETGEKAVGAVDLPDGAALVTVTRVVQGDINATAEAEITQIREFIAQRSGRMDFQSFFLAAEQDLDVQRPASQLAAD